MTEKDNPKTSTHLTPPKENRHLLNLIGKMQQSEKKKTSKTALQTIKARKEKNLSSTAEGSAIRFDHCGKIDGS